jgi:hypothetical protein
MYNEREALAYSGKLPAQQASITPQLLDLLAMQKVKSDKDAAARQLAMVSGQAPPTVAKGLEQDAMNSARQEISQKMGLAGLAQAQPPAGPMPQGLANVPTNLPTEYRGGGIIAFAEGGSGGDAHGRYRQDDQADNTDYSNEGKNYPLDATDTTEVQAAPNENVKFNDAIQAAVLRGLNQNPEALGREEIATQQEMLSPNREAAIARKREQQAGLKALYERQIAERPSNLQVALDRMAQNIREPGGFGAAMLGVSPAVQAAREGYTKQEIVQLNTLSAIDDEIDKAIENNDVSKYNAYVARKNQVRGEMKDALTSGASLANVLESMQGRKEMAAARIEEARRSRMADDARKRELANQAEATKRELANDRLLQLQIANVNRAGLTESAREANLFKLRLDAYEKAQKLISGNVALAGKSPEDQDAMATQMAASMIKNALAKPEAASASSATRLKFDAQGNQIK